MRGQLYTAVYRDCRCALRNDRQFRDVYSRTSPKRRLQMSNSLHNSERDTERLSRFLTVRHSRNSSERDEEPDTSFAISVRAREISVLFTPKRRYDIRFGEPITIGITFFLACLKWCPAARSRFTAPGLFGARMIVDRVESRST